MARTTLKKKKQIYYNNDINIDLIKVPLIFVYSFHEVTYSLQCHFQCLLTHICETHPEPTWFRTMARRPWRDVEFHFMQKGIPKLQFSFPVWFLQQWTQIHPAKQPCIPFQALYANTSQPFNDHLVPLSQPLPVGANVVLCELLIRQHRRQKVLCLRGY